MADFSSYVAITTTASFPKLLIVPGSTSGNYNDSGSYVTPPPVEIDPGSSYQFQLQDPSGPEGSQGQVAYSADGGLTLNVAYSCPYGADPNTGTAQITGADGYAVDVWAYSGDNASWGPYGPPQDGHPVHLWIGLRKSSESQLRPPE